MKNNYYLFQNRTYAKMFFAEFTSKMGSFIGKTAFLFYLLKTFSEKPSIASITELIYALPILFTFFLLGVVADTCNRQKVANIADLAALLLSLFLAFAIKTDSLPLIFLLLFTRQAVQSFFDPVQLALYQGILKKKDYATYAGNKQILLGILDLTGKGIGIFIFWWIGVEGAMILDSVSFFISYLLIRSCEFERQVLLPNGEKQVEDFRFKGILDKYKEGIAYISNHSLLPFLLFVFCLFGIINACFAILPVFLLKYHLSPHTYESISIWDGISVGVGYLLGGTFFSSVSNKIKNSTLIHMGLSLTGIFTVLLALSPNNVLYIIFMFAVTFFLTAVSVGTTSLIPSIVDPSFMGRVSGCVNPIATLFSVLSYYGFSVLFPKYVSAEILILVIGMLIIATGLLYFAWFRKQKEIIE